MNKHALGMLAINACIVTAALAVLAVLITFTLSLSTRISPFVLTFVAILPFISAGFGALYLIQRRFFSEELEEVKMDAPVAAAWSLQQPAAKGMNKELTRASSSQHHLTAIQEQLELEARRLELDRQRLDLEKERTDYALQTAYKFAEALRPEADPLARERLIYTLLPQLLRSLQAESWDLTLPEEQQEKIPEE